MKRFINLAFMALLITLFSQCSFKGIEKDNDGPVHVELKKDQSGYHLENDESIS